MSPKAKQLLFPTSKVSQAANAAVTTNMSSFMQTNKPASLLANIDNILSYNMLASNSNTSNVNPTQSTQSMTNDTSNTNKPESTNQNQFFYVNNSIMTNGGTGKKPVRYKGSNLVKQNSQQSNSLHSNGSAVAGLLAITAKPPIQESTNTNTLNQQSSVANGSPKLNGAANAEQNVELPPILSGKRINMPLGPHRYL
jgi:hypothetical protein